MSTRTAHIDDARCCGCTQCRLVCPAGAVVPRTARCRIDAARCTGCDRCRWACPLGCITLETAESVDTGCVSNKG